MVWIQIWHLAGALERKLIGRADSAMPVSHPIKNYLSKISKKEITVVHNTITVISVPDQDRNWWRQKFELDGSFSVAYVGLLRQDVGLEELIDAAAYFKKSSVKGIKFLLVGDGPDLSYIKSKDYVQFVPRVPHSEALRYVSACDLSYAVYKNKNNESKSEKDIRTKIKGGNTLVASPWKVFEAMACGTPVMVREGTFTWQFVNKIGFGIFAGSGRRK
jgi:glycosyltransferase involved in cell wall biosynthesis